MKNYELHIEYLKSGISINTNTGCNLGCKYCIVDEFSNRNETALSPEFIVDELCKFSFYNEYVPIFINNRTDPLLPNVKKNTFKLLELLKQKKLPNPRVIVSKLLIGEKWHEALYNSNAPIFLYRTFSGIPIHIEKTSTLQHFEHMAMENSILHKISNLYHVHYWRPIVPGINSDNETIINILNIAKYSFDCSVISGIRLTDNLHEKLIEFGADLSGWNGDTNHKYLQHEIYKNILNQRDKNAPSYDIFRNTSCAISKLLHRPDYNLNFHKARFCDGCVNLKTCSKHTVRAFDGSDILKNMDFTISSNKYKIIVNSPISQEQISFIKHAFGMSVEANNILKDKSEMLLENSKRR